MNTRSDMRRRDVSLAMVLSMAAHAWAIPSRFADPIDRPAQLSELQLRAPVVGIAAAGPALIAIGQRGRILRQSSPTAPWRQMSVPVSTDLCAVAFPSTSNGWAVGHDGIVLSSSDGGVSWQRRLDGRKAYEIELSYYEGLASRGDAAALRELKYLRNRASQAAARPFLDVWFRSVGEGYLVGAFGMLFRTSDAGLTWMPMADRTDNPKHHHLYAVRGDAENTYVAGEQGAAFRFDGEAGKFNTLDAPYKGALFGVAAHLARVIIYGLNGHAFLSDDRGTSWVALKTGTAQSIVGHAFSAHGDVLFATQAGRVMRLPAGGTRISSAWSVMAGEVFGIASAAGGRVVLATSNGPRAVSLGDSALDPLPGPTSGKS